MLKFLWLGASHWGQAALPRYPSIGLVALGATKLAICARNCCRCSLMGETEGVAVRFLYSPAPQSAAAMIPRTTSRRRRVGAFFPSPCVIQPKFWKEAPEMGKSVIGMGFGGPMKQCTVKTTGAHVGDGA